MKEGDHVRRLWIHGSVFLEKSVFGLLDAWDAECVERPLGGRDGLLWNIA